MNAILGDVKTGHEPDFSAIPGFEAWASNLFDGGQGAPASGRTPSTVLLGPPPPVDAATAPASPGRVPALIDVNSQPTPKPNASSTRQKYGKPCVKWTCLQCFWENSTISVCDSCTMSWMCAQSGCETVNISFPGLPCQKCSAECPIPLELANGADWFSWQPLEAGKNNYKMKDPEDPWTDRENTADEAAGVGSGPKKRRRKEKEESEPSFFAEGGVPDGWSVEKHLEETGAVVQSSILRCNLGKNTLQSLLKPKGHLTDEVMAIYISLLSTNPSSASADVMFWPSLLYTKYRTYDEPARGFRAIAKEVQRLEKPEFQRVFVPVYDTSTKPAHWFLITVDFTQKRICTMDSTDKWDLVCWFAPTMRHTSFSLYLVLVLSKTQSNADKCPPRAAYNTSWSESKEFLLMLSNHSSAQTFPLYAKTLTASDGNMCMVVAHHFTMAIFPVDEAANATSRRILESVNRVHKY